MPIQNTNQTFFLEEFILYNIRLGYKILLIDNSLGFTACAQTNRLLPNLIQPESLNFPHSLEECLLFSFVSTLFVYKVRNLTTRIL